MNQSSKMETAPQTSESGCWTWKRIFYWTAGVIVGFGLLAYFLVPPLASSYVHSRIVRTVEQRTGGTCMIDQLDVSWNGSITVRGLDISEPDGMSMMSFDQLHGQVHPLSALRGTYRFNATLSDPTLTLRRTEDGSLNLARLVTPADTANQTTERQNSSSLHLLSALYGTLNVENGSFHVVGPNGETTRLTAININASAEGHDSPARLSISATAPESSDESIQVNVSLHPSTGGNGSVKMELNNMSLSNFSPAASLFTDAQHLRGQIDGHLSVSRSSPVTSNARLKLTDVYVKGSGEPIQLPELSLSETASFDTSGTGTLSVEVTSGTAIRFSMEGNADKFLTQNGRLETSWTLSSSLPDASRNIPSMLNLKTGWRLEGTLSSTGNLVARRQSTDAETMEVQGTFSTKTRGRSVVSISPDGKRIDLGNPDLNAELDVHVAEHGNRSTTTPDPPFDIPSANLKSFSFDLPGLNARVSARGEQLMSAPRLHEINSSATLDLDTLQNKLSGFTDFGGYSAQGKMHLELSGSGRTPFKSTGQLRTDNLTVSPPNRKPLGPFNLKASQESAVHFGDRVLQLSNGRLSGEQFMAHLNDLHMKQPMNPGGTVEASGHLQADLTSLTGKFAPLLGPIYEQALNRSDVKHLNGSITLPEGKNSLRLQQTNEGPTVSGSLEANASNTSITLNNGKQLPVRKQLSTRLNGSFNRNEQTTRLETLTFQTGGLDLTLSETSIQSGASPIHINSLNANVNVNLTDLKNLTDVYQSEKPLLPDGRIEGNLHIDGIDHPRGQMTVETAMNVSKLQMTSNQGVLGPFTGDFTVPNGMLDLRPDRTSRFSDVRLRTESFRLSGQTELTDLHTGYPSTATVTINGEITDPNTASERLQPVLYGYRFSGQPVEVKFQGTRSPDGFSIDQYTVASESVTISSPSEDGRTVTLDNLNSTGSITKTSSKIDVTNLSVQSDAGMLKANGTTGIPGTDGPTTVDLKADLQGSISPLSNLISISNQNEESGDITGSINGALTLNGTLDDTSARAEFTAENVSYTPDEPGRPRVQNRRFTVNSDLKLNLNDQKQVRINALSLHSDGIRFRTKDATVQLHPDHYVWSDAEATLTYQANQLGPLVDPMLPLDLQYPGTESKTVQFQLDSGKAPAENLPYAFTGTGSYELGTVHWRGNNIHGKGNLNMNEDRGTITYDLVAGDGTIQGKSQIDLRSPARLDDPSQRSHRFGFDVRNVRVREQMAPALQRIHPVFTTLGGTTAGSIDLSYDLTLNGSLTGSEPMKRLSGPGWFRADNVDVRPNEFTSKILTLVDQKKRWILQVPRVKTRIDGRKIHHTDLPLKLSDHKLFSSGWVSSTGSYVLDVRIPITDELVRTYKQLKPLKGDHLTVPVSKTDGSVSVGLQSALQKALRKSIENRAERELEQRLNDLFD